MCRFLAIKGKYFASSEFLSLRIQDLKANHMFTYSQELLQIIGLEPCEIQPRGPSLELLYGENQNKDSCQVVHFDEWPEISKEFRSRPRLSCWPDPTLISDAIGCGNHVAPVGRSSSPNKSLEWRLSFSRSGGGRPPPPPPPRDAGKKR